MPIQREHMLQTAVASFIARSVVGPYAFTSVDRSQATSARQHLHEHGRGIKAGVSDCWLGWAGRYWWIELKTPGKKPDEHQVAWGLTTEQAGGAWFWADSVVGVHAALVAAGVVMDRMAPTRALDFDLRLQARLERAASAKPAAPGRPPRQRPKPSRLRAEAAIRAKGIMF